MVSSDSPAFTVQLVTKPLSPPWIDSARNLPRYLVEHAVNTSFRILTSHRDESDHIPGTHNNRFELQSDHPRRILQTPVFRSTPGLTISGRDRLRLLMCLGSELLRSRLTPTLFHFFFTPNPPTSRMAAAMCHINSAAPAIQTVTSCPDPAAHPRRWIFPRRLIALSRYTQRFLEKELNRPVDLIYPGIPEKRAQLQQKMMEIPNRFGLSDGFNVLYAGDLHDSGSMPFWRVVLPEWRQQFPSLRLIIAMRDKHPLDPEHRVELEKIGGSQIRFPGVVDDMQGLIAACDVMIFPVMSLHSKMDFPLVLLEAMALRKPVLISTVNSLNELVATGGVMSGDPTRPETFSAALSEMMNSPSLRERIGQTGQDVVSRQFSAEKMAAAYETVYRAEFEGLEARSRGRSR